MENNAEKHRISVKRKTILFSTILFTVILAGGSTVYTVSMWKNFHIETGHELASVVEIERIKLEAAVNAEIAKALDMAASPLIKRYLHNPLDSEISKIALEEINGYREAFAGKSIFWMSDTDKEFYYDKGDHYTVDPDDPESYWYNMTLNETEKKFNFNINYNTEMQRINLWINALVSDSENKPLGLVGTGIDLSDFVDAVFNGYTSNASLYFFNATGEITGARNMNLITDKITLDKELGSTGAEILFRSENMEDNEIQYFSATGGNEIALAKISALDWYIAAVLPLTLKDALNSNMTLLFLIMMALIAAIFVIYDAFINKLLKSPFTYLSRMNELYDRLLSANERLTALSATDELTKLNNRRSFLEYIEIIWKQSHRLNLPVTVMMIDIDYFKRYNDSLGHLEGDKTLVAIAQCMKNQLRRETDFVARFGGEEFICLLPYIEKSEAINFANRLIQSVEDMKIPHPMSEVSKYVTISAGIACAVPDENNDWEQLLDEADKAMYKAKSAGRNRVAIYDR